MAKKRNRKPSETWAQRSRRWFLLGAGATIAAVWAAVIDKMVWPFAVSRLPSSSGSGVYDAVDAHPLAEMLVVLQGVRAMEYHHLNKLIPA